MTQPPDENQRYDTDFIEGLVFRCLESENVAATAAALCAQHPAAAARLRRVLDRLETEGLGADAAAIESTLHHALMALPCDLGDEIEAPERLGDFRILSRLGAGGMGVVYLAVDEKLGRQVAVKLVRPEQLYFPGARLRFEREIEAIARLHHPGIVTIHSVGEQDGVPFFAMDYVRGMPLSRLIAGLAGQNPARLRGQDFHDQLGQGETPASGSSAQVLWTQVVTRLIREVADALAHAHAQGVLHRDVKPSNILIGQDHRPRLLDFGLARTDGAQQITKSTAQLGSLPYMAPEQLETGAEAQTPSLDVYALGVTMYEMLTLRSPYLAATPEATRARILAATPAAPRSLNSAIGVDLETVCLTAMEKAAARRYASMATFIEDLDNLLERRPIQARPAGRLLRSWRWCQRHPTLAVGLGMAALLFALVVQFAMQQRTSARRTEATNYVLGITAASSQMDQSRTREAMASLDLCPPHLRRFEWNFLELRGRAHDAEYRGHTDRVRWVAMHPGGEEFVSASNDGTVRFWRLRDVAPYQTFRPAGAGRSERRGRLEFLCCAYATDGGAVFAGGNDGRLYRIARDGSSGSPVFKSAATSIQRIAVAAAGDLLAIGLGDGRVELLRAPSGELLADIETERTPALVAGMELDQPVQALAFSRDDRTLLVGWLNQVQVCDVAARRQVACIEHGQQDIVTALTVAADGRRLLSGTVFGRIHLWDLGTRQSIVASDPSRTVAITAGVFDDVNGRIMVAGERGPIVVYDAVELEHLYRLQGHEGTVTHMVLGGDRRTILTSSYDETIRRWEVGTPASARVFGRHDGVVRTLEVTADSRFAITGGADGRLRRWNLRDRSVRELWPRHPKGVRATSLAPDNRWLLVLAESLFVLELPAADRSENRSRAAPPPPREVPCPERLHLIAWLPGGKRFVGGASSGKLRLFDAASGRELAQNLALGERPDCRLQCLVVCGWDGRIVGGTSQGTLVVFDADTLAIEREIPAHPRGLHSLAVDTSSRVVVSGDYQGLLRFWNPVAGSNTRPEVLWKDEVISSIAFNPAFDRMITSTMGRQIQIWDTAHMRRLLLLGGHTKAVLGARFTPDGTRILSVSMDGTLRMWDSRPREAMKRR